ncbi:MAG: sensor histidine kinase [Spirochaetia bacterium]|nr:sensor histidine kinase [Spirochaetia bacterium]
MGRPRYFKRIFTLFLAAAMAPAAGISIVYTFLAGSAIRHEAESRLDSQATAFARTVASIADDGARDLAVIATDPAVRAALRPPGNNDAALMARALRKIYSTFPQYTGQAEASVLSTDGSIALLLGDIPSDRDMATYGSWGIFRALSSTNIALTPRVSTLSDGQKSSFTIGVAIRAENGDRLGYALADVRRSAIASAAVSSGLQGGVSLVFPSGKIIFDQSDPSREGLFIEDVSMWSDETYVSEAKAFGAGADFTVLAASPTGLYNGFGRSARTVALAGLAGAAALASALALKVSSSVTKPVLEMATSMKLVEAGDLSIRIVPSADDELGDLARSFNAMTAEVDALLRSEVERQELLREAELKALAAQMNPHFLHNTLASIKSLAKLGRSAEIAQVVARLGKILRAGTGRRDGYSTIGDSLSFVRDYLSIEKVRFGDRFTFTIEVDPRLEGVSIPPLTLEPLTENALTHGLERKRGSGSLHIEGRLEGDDAVISFEDDGPGMEEEAIGCLQASLEAAEPPSGAHGIGLLGTNRRLALEFGPEYGIRIDQRHDGGFKATLRIPAGERS